jgi:hypothetical protein
MFSPLFVIASPPTADEAIRFSSPYIPAYRQAGYLLPFAFDFAFPYIPAYRQTGYLLSFAFDFAFPYILPTIYYLLPL